VIAKRIPNASNESVNLVVSLLVRHPEISRVVIKPGLSGIALFFVVRTLLGGDERARLRRAVGAHVRALRELSGLESRPVDVRLSAGGDLTFIEIELDGKTLARDEIAMIVGLVAQTFGERLVVNPPAEDGGEEDAAMQDESVGAALDAVRRGRHRKGLVGFRDDRRVLIYFGKR